MSRPQDARAAQVRETSQRGLEMSLQPERDVVSGGLCTNLRFQGFRQNRKTREIQTLRRVLRLSGQQSTPADPLASIC